ncbi:MAG: Asp-tRNA(Asn)/Glu-tRNA(Gln) amidotransferase subunit GatC [Patescibacteria group bacterium]|nr:Asp-tRNA(Asn)/Glu-tRNA(Gln) amidotransferase subunit GatC [Patescibacteria group bacterium]MDE1988429.1 Asp-tRNA(Asn)/Glu-tRNA(Gln) amidotransferase subunit GatC [Patescibacteria group bacterium]MDE2218255.1 Asp-tRNA(Asn)/Glu-tRNA(Gln) amidotransferase subunit GatC [Patescibacteria group bacterium]
MIEIKEIEKLAELSRIEISDEEKKTFLKDIDSILGYVGQIKAVAGTANSINSREESKLKNIFREDANPHDPGQFTEDLLAVAPEKENDCIKVKKIL